MVKYQENTSNKIIEQLQNNLHSFIKNIFLKIGIEVNKLNKTNLKEFQDEFRNNLKSLNENIKNNNNYLNKIYNEYNNHDKLSYENLKLILANFYFIYSNEFTVINNSSNNINNQEQNNISEIENKINVNEYFKNIIINLSNEFYNSSYIFYDKKNDPSQYITLENILNDKISNTIRSKTINLVNIVYVNEKLKNNIKIYNNQINDKFNELKESQIKTNKMLENILPLLLQSNNNNVNNINENKPKIENYINKFNNQKMINEGLISENYG